LLSVSSSRGPDLRRWRDVLAPGPTAFVIASGRLDDVMPTLTSLFPDGELRQYDNGRNGAPLLSVYFADIPDVSGANQSDQNGDA